jgi:hypothetical protein
MVDASVIEHAFIYPPNIDWWLLGQAVEHFGALGYQQVETPWAIPKLYMDGTKPHNDTTFELHQGQFTNQHHELVGSAEQGFVYMKARKMLPVQGTRFMSVSPCFRVEQFDSLHLPWFMKLELFDSRTDPICLELMLIDALNIFKTLVGRQGEQQNEFEIVNIGDTFDINMNGIEIGSYGIRRHVDPAEDYIYGTGLALPRFTQARR